MRKTPYTFAKNLILRTPQYSFMAQGDEASLREALFLASPVLLSEWEKLQRGDIKDEKEAQRIRIAVAKYDTRLRSRATPFGLFAACGMAAFSDSTKTLQSADFKRNTRLDMNYSGALAQHLANLPELRQLLLFYPNNSQYVVGEQLRYIEYHYKDLRRVHCISSVDFSDYVARIIAEAHAGKTLRDLAQSIVDEEISFEEALEFVQQIADAQLLVSELDTAITGGDFTDQILRVLNKVVEVQHLDDLSKVQQVLQQCQQSLQTIDENGNNEVAAYQAIADALRPLEVEFELSKLFQTDLSRHAVFELEESVQTQLFEALETLNKLGTYRENTNLKQFREAFYKRYETREVSLLEALDVECGIGYLQQNRDASHINPFVDTIAAGSGKPSEGNYEIQWNNKYNLLLNKYLDAIRNSLTEVEILDKDLEKIEAKWDNIPLSMSMMFSVVGQCEDGSPQLHLHHSGGASALSLLGRFAEGDDAIRAHGQAIAAEEQKRLSEQTVLAEIVHLPESRTGNILLHPPFYRYEIPFLAKANPDSETIDLQDLMLSVRGNSIYLRSRKLNKRVLPRLSNAHNYSYNALPVYQFLCDLQHQHTRSGFSFDWGPLQMQLGYLPRVHYKNVILAQATWHLKKADFENILNANDWLSAICAWREKHKLPRHIALADGDNELYVDLDNELSVAMFVSTIKKRSQIQLIEFLFDAEKCPIRNELGEPYVNQFVAALLKEVEPQVVPQNATKTQGIATIKRDFTIGSEWLFYKIYCGHKTADLILTEVIKPLVAEFRAKDSIEKFFFIRYSDPEPHLRVRFYHSQGIDFHRVITKFYAAIDVYITRGLVAKIQSDTYQREVERYGENTMSLSESLFMQDSFMTLEMLSRIEGSEGEEYRWRYAFRAIDDLLDNFELSLSQKKALLLQLKTNFFQEFNGNKYLTQQLSGHFRTHRGSLLSILGEPNDDNEINELLDIFESQKADNHNIAKQILAHYENKTANVELFDLLSSYIHMTLNRLFAAQQRKHELVVYDLLYRYYDGKLARG
jgi:lantibiotic biosynthesis protein